MEHEFSNFRILGKKVFSLLAFLVIYSKKTKNKIKPTVKMLKQIIAIFGLVALFSLGIVAPSLAQEAAHNATPWSFLTQAAASPSAERIHEFHDMLVYIIISITLFVLALLIIVIVRFNKRSNPVPSKTTHNVLLEVLWTALPVVILIIIAIPSFKLLYYVDRTETPEMTLKVTGYQWYWGYEYPDHGGVNFMSYLVPEDEINAEEGQLRLLSTDRAVVLPINKNIQIDVTAADVLHSWAVPALGVKTDSVPGRLNSTWFNITKPGTYYGQCSELCGKDHAYMPIEIRAVSQEEFEQWILEQGGTMPTEETVAEIEAENGENGTTKEVAPPDESAIQPADGETTDDKAIQSDEVTNLDEADEESEGEE